MFNHLPTLEQYKEANPEGYAEMQSEDRKRERREAWLRARRGRITASGVGSFFTSALKVADNKTSNQYLYERISELNGAEIPRSSSAAMQWGHDQEPYAVIEYMKVTGHNVSNWGDGEAYEVDGQTYQSDGQKFLTLGEYEGATPDGLILPTMCLQIKSPHNPGIHQMYCFMDSWERIKKLEYKYYVQMQHEMRVVRATFGPQVTSCEFVSYDPRNKKQPLKIINVPYDEEFQPILEETIAAKIELIKAA